MRHGKFQEGFADLQTAASLDPNRAIMRSYLAKALDTLGGERTAVEQELARAMNLDPNDPTAWLYAALIHYRENEINRSIRELEEARAKSNYRALFRSRQLLDEDRAVSAANLALLYSDVGMTDVARREAAAAVQSDYSTHSSHLFLANSYAELQDPRRANLRFENATVSEYLLANLLSPAGAGAFSPRISQEEYTRLFERNRLGFVSQTEYESNGTWRQGASQFGIFGGTSYALEQIYRSEAPPHLNGAVEEMSFSATFKQQLTPDDLLYVQSIYDWTKTGDARQLDDPNDSLRSVRATDEQLPFLLAGYNHQWQPGVTTLLIGGFVNDDYNLSLTNEPVAAFGRSGDSITRVPVTQPAAPWIYEDRQKLYTIEAQQIFETGRNTLIAGARYQTADHITDSALDRSTLFQFQTAAGIFPGTFRANANSQSIVPNFERISIYGYDTFEVFDNFYLTAGLSYDRLQTPRNFQNPPLTDGNDNTDRVSPKAGLLWRPTDSTLLRAAYSQSISGASFDQSIRIEPTQIGGFNQAFRSLIPESLAGSIVGARFETFGVGADQKIGKNLYLGIEGEWLESKADRTFGTVDFQTTFPFSQSPGTATELLRFRERSLLGTLNYLIGDYIALGVRHQLSDAKLESVIPQVAAPFSGRAESEGLLNQTDIFAIINHPLGFFSEVGATHYNQQTQNRPSGLPDDDFWQVNLSLGWRSPRRNVEAMVSLLNVNDQDYRLYPINLYRDPPRERTFAARLRLNF
jgi:outer membrane receptor protein involved in Fe transport